MSRRLYWDETPAQTRARKLLAAKTWRENNVEKAREYRQANATWATKQHHRKPGEAPPAVDTSKPVTLPIVAWLLREPLRISR